MITPLQKLPKNVGDLDKLIVSKGFKKLPKVQKIAQSGHTDPDVSHHLHPFCIPHFASPDAPAVARLPHGGAPHRRVVGPIPVLVVERGRRVEGGPARDCVLLFGVSSLFLKL